MHLRCTSSHLNGHIARHIYDQNKNCRSIYLTPHHWGNDANVTSQRTISLLTVMHSCTCKDSSIFEHNTISYTHWGTHTYARYCEHCKWDAHIYTWVKHFARSRSKHRSIVESDFGAVMSFNGTFSGKPSTKLYPTPPVMPFVCWRGVAERASLHFISLPFHNLHNCFHALSSPFSFNQLPGCAIILNTVCQCLCSPLFGKWSIKLKPLKVCGKQQQYARNCNLWCMHTPTIHHCKRISHQPLFATTLVLLMRQRDRTSNHFTPGDYAIKVTIKLLLSP